MFFKIQSKTSVYQQFFSTYTVLCSLFHVKLYAAKCFCNNRHSHYINIKVACSIKTNSKIITYIAQMEFPFEQQWFEYYILYVISAILNNIAHQTTRKFWTTQNMQLKKISEVISFKNVGCQFKNLLKQIFLQYNSAFEKVTII